MVPLGGSVTMQHPVQEEYASQIAPFRSSYTTGFVKYPHFLRLLKSYSQITNSELGADRARLACVAVAACDVFLASHFVRVEV